MMQRRKIRPWSKLQKEVYLLVDPKLDFQIHCVAYRMGSQYGSTDLPRYWITLGKETIFDYPKHFIHSEGPNENSRIAYEALSIRIAAKPLRFRTCFENTLIRLCRN